MGVVVLAVGTDVGLVVGTDVGLAVGTDVGLAVGTDVGLAVGTDVGFEERMLARVGCWTTMGVGWFVGRLDDSFTERTCPLDGETLGRLVGCTIIIVGFVKLSVLDA